ncbi:hypothetical protein [Radicibacter daui]|uniref:hypothetical protein n=1 Tax=Radicibacter daui TaxID=3064829 RepID=UPI004046F2C7
MSAKYGISLILVASLGATACATYLDQKADLVAGGPQQRVAQAQSNYNAAVAANQNLEDQRLSLERDIERNEKRITAAQDQLKKANRDLASALAQKKLSQEQYAKLKSQSDAINRELAKLDLQTQADQNNSTNGPEIAARQARIEELEKRKAELDKAIGLALGG